MPTPIQAPLHPELRNEKFDSLRLNCSNSSVVSEYLLTGKHPVELGVARYVSKHAGSPLIRADCRSSPWPCGVPLRLSFPRNGTEPLWPLCPSSPLRIRRWLGRASPTQKTTFCDGGSVCSLNRAVSDGRAIYLFTRAVRHAFLQQKAQFDGGNYVSLR